LDEHPSPRSAARISLRREEPNRAEVAAAARVSRISSATLTSEGCDGAKDEFLRAVAAQNLQMVKARRVTRFVPRKRKAR
jgi:hypothetical protein